MKMNKKIFALALALVMLSVVGCDVGDKSSDDGVSNGNNDHTPEANIELLNDEVIFKGKVTSIDNQRFIEVEIIDSSIAFGTYWVLVSDLTEFYDFDGNSIERSTIRVDDVIEIVFSGQVMNSYPPQIAAKRIFLH